jgi:biotin/methionine sulfoxide reductase
MEQITPHASHWGFFDAVVRDGRFVEARPFAGDAAAPQLIASMPEVVHSRARVDRPTSARAGCRGGAPGTCAAATPSCR